MQKKDMPFFSRLKLLNSVKGAYFTLETNKYGYVFVWSFSRFLDEDKKEPVVYQSAFHIDYEDIEPSKCKNREIDTLEKLVEWARYTVENFDQFQIERGEDISAHSDSWCWYMPVCGGLCETFRKDFNTKDNIIF